MLRAEEEFRICYICVLDQRKGFVMNEWHVTIGTLQGHQINSTNNWHCFEFLHNLCVIPIREIEEEENLSTPVETVRSREGFWYSDLIERSGPSHK